MSSSSQASNLVCQCYANALIQQAESAKALNKVEKDMADLKAMLGASTDLDSVVRNPLLGRESLQAAMFAVADKAKFQSVTKNFLGTLVQNGRLYALAKIIAAFEVVLSEKRGEVKVNVSVAQDLTAKQKKDLEASLSKELGADIVMNVKVEPKILGGMVITIGSQMIDNSVARKLERLKASLEKQRAA